MKTLLVALALFTAHPVNAQVGVGVGYTRYLDNTGFNLGDYASPMVAYNFSLNDTVTVTPAVGFEYAPKTKFWGPMVGANVDFKLHPHFGLDAAAWYWTDGTNADLPKAAMYVGPGAGFSIFVGNWNISPSVAYYRGWNGGVKTVFVPWSIALGYMF